MCLWKGGGGWGCGGGGGGGGVGWGEGGGVSPLGAISQWVKPWQVAEENVVIIQGEHQHAFTLDLFLERV